MIALVFLATVVNYLDRQTLSVAAPVLREQFHMSNQDYSRVVFAFLLAYTISNGFSGAIIDRLGTRAGYALCDRDLVGRRDAACAGQWSRCFSPARDSCWASAKRETGRQASEWLPSGSRKQERALASGIVQQRLVGRGDPCAAGGRLDLAPVGLAARLPRDRLCSVSPGSRSGGRPITFPK